MPWPDCVAKRFRELLGQKRAHLWLLSIVCCGLWVVDAAAAARGLVAAPPRPLREMRGAWIATVANLDWPSKPGLSTADQKAEMIGLLDKAVHLNLNFVILQVRPACDVFYSSPFEPWSEFLTGKMGQAPDPFYDPLEFAVEEAHRRGLELHAWFNPFRVRAANFKSGSASNYVQRTHPEYIRGYGSQLWLDPGLKAVREHCLKVILDVVKRYDIDGVHLDDYFYPYPEKNSAGQVLDFPDDPSWQRYLAAGGKLSRADWRRKNIDEFVEALYSRVKAEKRWVKVGISPFGIWRPGYPKQVKKGLDAYDQLYADSRKWLALGWVDYFAPQLYWAIDAADQSYPALLNWWVGQNPRGRLLCPGLDTTKVGGAWPTTEIVNQLRLTRKQNGAQGNVMWNLTSLSRNPDHLSDTLARGFYSQPALLPPCGWLEESLPAKPLLLFEQHGGFKSARATWSDPGHGEPWFWLYQIRRKGKWTTRVLFKDQSSCPLYSAAQASLPEAVAVTGITRCGGVGPTAVLELKPTVARSPHSDRERTLVEK